MKITQIEIVYSRTFNLGNYENVRPSIKLVAELDEGEGDIEARQELMDLARQQWQTEVDRALEQNDRPPEFYPGARYLLYYNSSEQLAVLVRMAEREQLPACWRRQSERWRNHRREFILGRYVDEMGNYRLIEVVDGDTSQLPELVWLTTIEHEEENLLALVPGDTQRHDIVKERGEGWWNSYSGFTKWRLLEKPLAEARAEAEEKGYTFIDASDGDLEKLPFLEAQGDDEANDDDIPDEDEYLDDDDWDEDEHEWD